MKRMLGLVMFLVFSASIAFAATADEYHWEGRFYMSVYPGTGGTLRDSSIIQNARLGAYSITDKTPQEVQLCGLSLLS